MTYSRRIPPTPLVVSQSLMPPTMDLTMSMFPENGMGYPMSLSQNGYPYANIHPSNLFAETGYNSVLLQNQMPMLSSVNRPSHHPPPVPDPHDCLSPVDQRSLMKVEEGSTLRPNRIFSTTNAMPLPRLVTAAEDVDFGTDVDSLMRAIQTKSRPKHQLQQQQLPTTLPVPPQHRSTPHSIANMGGTVSHDSRARKRYQCNLATCAKSFFQKTHLEIHMRAHTGDKPFVCKEPSCGQRFSQLGNLKTHERRHTGERPYSCESCGKRFAQRGNVRAHRIVHEQAKPFLCKLESCGKRFTQLGNLKSHQNKFHAQSLRNLTLRFASMREGDPVTAQDKELWEYFATLYKNSNKGIKGRGKDRRISAIFKAGSGAGVKQERCDRSGSSDSSTIGGQPDVSDLDGPTIDGDSSASSYSNDDHDFALAGSKIF